MSSCSTLRACLSPAKDDAKEREDGRRDWVIVAVEAMLRCEEEEGGDDLEGGDNAVVALVCDETEAAGCCGAIEERFVGMEAEIGFSVADR